MSDIPKTKRVRDLVKGDTVLFSPSLKREVLYCVPSSIDPVHLIAFTDNPAQQIAKAPDDEVAVE
jgi:hypothetical protein